MKKLLRCIYAALFMFCFIMLLMNIAYQIIDSVNPLSANVNAPSLTRFVIQVLVTIGFYVAMKYNE